ncbi:MAG: tetratricopeptide repeat protein [Hydrogenophaga sp.]
MSRLLSDLLLDVPLARGHGDAAVLLHTLERAARLTPVFADAPTPVDGWLKEAEALAREPLQPRVLARLAIRTAEVHMRRSQLAAALQALTSAETHAPLIDEEERTWLRTTRARVWLRQQRLADAARELEALDAVSWRVRIAAGELALESGDLPRARDTFARLLPALPWQQVEERIPGLQSLGFIAIVRGEPVVAVRHLEAALECLRAVAYWPEVIATSVTLGGLHTALGHHGVAQRLLAQARELSERHPSPPWEAFGQMGVARLNALQGRTDAAVQAALDAASRLARQGSLVGYVGMLVFVARLHTEAGQHDQAYRTLATGVAIAKHRAWPQVERLLREKIDHLRNEVLGPAAFDAMVQRLVDEAHPA